MGQKKNLVLAAALTGMLLGTSVPASAAIINYNLQSHPDGGIAPPFYGLRLDGLYTLDTNDEWTFDFDHASSNMKLVLDTTLETVRIYGEVYGGLDVGAGYDADLQGLWAVDFSYSVNVSVDDSGLPDLEVEVSPEAPASNNGYIRALFTADDGSIFITSGDTIAMEQEKEFFFNNTDDHRLDCLIHTCGPDQFVGWGWLNHSDSSHIEASDWLFTATVVPIPAAVWMFISGLGALAFVRRRLSG